MTVFFKLLSAARACNRTHSVTEEAAFQALLHPATIIELVTQRDELLAAVELLLEQGTEREVETGIGMMVEQTDAVNVAIAAMDRAKGKESAQVPAGFQALASAVWQALDDMGKDGHGICEATKARLRHAYEPFNEHAGTNGAPEYQLEMAVKTLESVGLL